MSQVESCFCGLFEYIYRSHLYNFSLYSSVITWRKNIINSSASAPLNATKIAVKKISDVDICMFVPEFEFSMYKCCFLSCFCASQRVQQRKAELTLAQIREKLPNGWADNGTKCGTHVQIHMGMDIRQPNYPGDTRGHLAGFRGSAIQKSGEAVRLAPTLVLVCGFIWEWT